MQEILIMTGWTFAVGFVAYSIGRASLAENMKQLRRDNYYLRRWCDQQARATMETDLELELERIRRNA